MKNSFIISLLVFILYMMASCRTEYIPIESVRYDSVFLEKIQKDSIFVKDSVYIRQKGDTVFKDKFIVVYKERLLRDTMLTVKTDSIPVPVPVEKKRTWWEQFKIDFATIAIQLIVLVIFYLIIKWIFKRFIKK